MLWRGGKGLESTWVLAGTVVLATFGWWGTQREVRSPVRPFLWWSLGGFLAWTGFSFVLSTTRNYGLDEVLRDGSCVLIVLWTLRMLAGSQGMILRRRLLMTITVGLLLACAIGIAVYILQPVNRFVGTFFDARFVTDYWPNAWADLVLVAWPVTLLWTLTWKRVWKVLYLGLPLGCLLLSYSRGGMLAFGGQVVALGVIWFWSTRQNFRTITRTLLDVVAVGLVAVIIFFAVNAVRTQFHAVQSFENRVTFQSDEGTSSVDERRLFWEQSLTLSLERPFVGWGPYSFRFVQPRLQTGVLQTSDHPHNVVLKLAMERGWPAAILFVAILLAILLPVCVRVVRRRVTNGEEILLLSILGVLAHSMIDYNLQFVGVALPFWVLLGFLAMSGPVTSFSNTKFVRFSEVSIAMLIGIVAVTEARYLVLSSFGRHAEAAGNTEAALAWYEQSRGEQFSRDLHLSRANLLLRDGKFDPAQRALDEYSAQNDHDARAWILRGRASGAAGNTTASLAAFDRALSLGRYNHLEALLGVLQNLSSTDQRDVLSSRRTEFEDLARAYHRAILENAHFIALSSSVEVFTDVTDLLATLYPDSAATYRQLGTEARDHATEERRRFGERPPGFLW